jgi:gluconate 2-dehydrogenase gamma chain
MLAIAEEAHAAHLNGAAFTTLSDAEAVEIEAIAAQIIPTDDTPGAREAGVIYFIDRILGERPDGDLPSVREGLADLTERTTSSHAGVSKFSDLTAPDQIALLTEIEDTPFFETLRFLTMAGMFAHPSCGGNRDRIGWKLIGFDDRHFWQPPFGHYDANYEGAKDNGE